MITEPELERRLKAARDAVMNTTAKSTADDAEIAAVVPTGDAPPSRRPGVRTRRFAVGAVTAGLAAAAVAIGLAITTGSNPSATSGAADNSAAPSTAATAPGPYTYVKVTASEGVSPIEQWVPSDPLTGTWMLRRPDGEGGAPVVQTATCAAFAFYRMDSTTKTSDENGNLISEEHPTQPGCDTTGGWMLYRPQFAASLPTDPAAVLAMLRQTGLGAANPDAGAFETGSDFVGSGVVPHDVAAVVVSALKLIPGVTVTPNTTNAAGATGDLIAYTGRIKGSVPETFSVVVDPATGNVVGSGMSWSGGSYDTLITRTQVATAGATS